jgi:hypothetical protein
MDKTLNFFLSSVTFSLEILNVLIELIDIIIQFFDMINDILSRVFIQFHILNITCTINMIDIAANTAMVVNAPRYSLSSCFIVLGLKGGQN